MDTDVRGLRPSELSSLLNSTHLGYVISTTQLNAHRVRAGLRIANGKRVDLLRYLAWLVAERHARPAGAVPLDKAEASRLRAAEHSKALSLSIRDIGEIPERVNPVRWAACERDFKLFAETYFPERFYYRWSQDHLDVIKDIETSVLHGGLLAVAMPRAAGKTSLVEVASIWAALYGHRLFVAVIGSDEGHANDMLDSIKSSLELSDLLFEDFPEICYPIRCLEGIPHRCGGQLYKGKRTHIAWTAREVVLPSIPGAPGGGVIIKVAGLTGGIRGMKFTRPDGRTERPSLALIDDPQTDASAASVSQCEQRERILAGAVLGLAGPGKKIAALMPCTVIRTGDVADNLLDRIKHPDWNGRRTKMVYRFPANMKLWEEYKRLRAEGMNRGDAGRAATEFYARHRDEMDEGAVVAWQDNHDPDEISALQHAMNLLFRNERAFHAEYQNEPMPEESARTDDLTADQIMARVNRLPRGAVPLSCSHVTAFIDVQASMLFYVVCGWKDDFTGWVIDYGSFPDQKRPYFTLRDATIKLDRVIKNAGMEGRIRGALDVLTAALFARVWPRDDGAEMHIEKCLIDANWGASTETIYEFCRATPFASLVMPSHGKYVGASSRPMREYQKSPGDKEGLNWRVPALKKSHGVRHVVYDTNYWKSFIQSRLSVALGDNGALTLFGTKPDAHRMLADHLTAEYKVRTEGRGRTVDEWKARPERPDNHWLDCLVGSAVAASMCGVTLASMTGPVVKRPRVKLSELQRQRRGG